MNFRKINDLLEPKISKSCWDKVDSGYSQSTTQASASETQNDRNADSQSRSNKFESIVDTKRHAEYVGILAQIASSAKDVVATNLTLISIAKETQLLVKETNQNLLALIESQSRVSEDVEQNTLSVEEYFSRRNDVSPRNRTATTHHARNFEDRKQEKITTASLGDDNLFGENLISTSHSKGQDHIFSPQPSGKGPPTKSITSRSTASSVCVRNTKDEFAQSLTNTTKKRSRSSQQSSDEIEINSYMTEPIQLSASTQSQNSTNSSPEDFQTYDSWKLAKGRATNSRWHDGRR